MNDKTLTPDGNGDWTAAELNGNGAIWFDPGSEYVIKKDEWKDFDPNLGFGKPDPQGGGAKAGQLKVIYTKKVKAEQQHEVYVPYESTTSERSWTGSGRAALTLKP